MDDWAHEWTDKQIDALKRKFEDTYRQAEREMRQKLEEHMAEYDRLNKEWKKALKAGSVTKQQYDEWLRVQSMRQEYMVGMVDTLAADATRADVLARDYINDALPAVYAENANYGAYQVESGIGFDTQTFTLYDRDTIRHLMGMDEHTQLIHEVIPMGPAIPELQSLRVDLDVVKDVRWNRQKFTAAITQSILQGESIPNTAKRLRTVLNMDRTMAVRAARTAMTGAESAGRVESYRRANRIGVRCEKQWLATLDVRTRASHRELDGQHVPYDRPFVAESTGHKLMRPGDPAGHPSEVYNCRCRVIAWFPDDDTKITDDRWSRLPKGMTYEAWKESKPTYRRKKGKAGKDA